jgi:hypothetical protein
MQSKLVGIVNVDFNPTDQLQIVHSTFVKYFRKNSICEISRTTSSQIFAVKSTPAAANTIAVEDTCSLNLNGFNRELNCINPNPPGNLKQTLFIQGIEFGHGF